MAAELGSGRIDPTDEELIARVLEGDEAAFTWLYERYFPRVFQFTSRRVRNRADAEETVQEIFINVFSSLESFRAEAPFSAWVLGVSRRTIANRFKKKRHATVPLDEHEESDAAIDPLAPSLHREPTPLEYYECQERLALLEEAAELHLTSEQRRLFELHHLRHRSIHDLARFFRKSEDAVKSHLYRARKLLLAR